MASEQSKQDFDFDLWAQLARRDPGEFFRRREALIRAFIDSAPAEHRASLIALQGEIDAMRAIAGSPIGAVKQMMVMIEDRLGAMQSQMHRLRTEADRCAELADRLRG